MFTKLEIIESVFLMRKLYSRSAPSTSCWVSLISLAGQQEMIQMLNRMNKVNSSTESTRTGRVCIRVKHKKLYFQRSLHLYQHQWQFGVSIVASVQINRRTVLLSAYSGYRDVTQRQYVSLLATVVTGVWVCAQLFSLLFKSRTFAETVLTGDRAAESGTVPGDRGRLVT